LRTGVYPANDVAVAHRLLDELAVDTCWSLYQEATVLVNDWIAHDQSHQLEELHNSVRRFSRQSALWEK